MVEVTMKVEGLDEIIQQMQALPRTLDTEMGRVMHQSMHILESKVPDYPPVPAGSKYIRRHLLGNSLTASGDLHVSKIEKLGGMHQATFGSAVKYAPYVISDEMQAETHQGWWWTMSVIAERAQSAIEQLFQAVAEKMARFLDRQK